MKKQDTEFARFKRIMAKLEYETKKEAARRKYYKTRKK